MSQYRGLVEQAAEYACISEDPEQIKACTDKLAVAFGKEILRYPRPGLDRGGRRPLLRQGGDSRQGPAT